MGGFYAAEIPDSKRSVLAAGDSISTIGDKVDAGDWFPMAVQGSQALAGSQIPCPKGVVMTA